MKSERMIVRRKNEIKEIKISNNLSDIAVMASAPLDGYTPKNIREMMVLNKTDKDIAEFMAIASNQTAWISHEVNDPDNDEKTNSRIRSEYDAWWTLEIELYSEIIRRFEENNQFQVTVYTDYNIRFYNIINSFMERNGYCDRAGWWIKFE